MAARISDAKGENGDLPDAVRPLPLAICWAIWAAFAAGLWAGLIGFF